MCALCPVMSRWGLCTLNGLGCPVVTADCRNRQEGKESTKMRLQNACIVMKSLHSNLVLDMLQAGVHVLKKAAES